MWTLEFPFFELRDKIKEVKFKPHMKLNHFPGISCITNKLKMATSTKSEFVPKGFKFPEQFNEFNIFVEENPDAKFVVKNFDNRGVKVVTKEIVKELMWKKERKR